nr:hypothetical protein CFP56_56701 [Quercus suber]
MQIVPYREDLPLIGNIVLESTPPSSARIHSIRRFVVAKSRPPLPRKPLDSPPSNKTYGSKRKTSPPVSFAASERRSKHKRNTSATRPIILDKAEIYIEHIFIYTPISEKAHVGPTIGMTVVSTKGNVPTWERGVTATREVSIEVLIPQLKPVFPKEDVSIMENVVKEFFLVSSEFSTPSKGGVSPMVA